VVGWGELVGLAVVSLELTCSTVGDAGNRCGRNGVGALSVGGEAIKGDYKVSKRQMSRLH